MVVYFTRQRLLLDLCKTLDGCECEGCGTFGMFDMCTGDPCVYFGNRPRVFVRIRERLTGIAYMVRVWCKNPHFEAEYFDSYFTLEQGTELMQFLHYMFDITA